jgi:hypothetical protein
MMLVLLQRVPLHHAAAALLIPPFYDSAPTATVMMPLDERSSRFTATEWQDPQNQQSVGHFFHPEHHHCLFDIEPIRANQ